MHSYTFSWHQKFKVCHLFHKMVKQAIHSVHYLILTQVVHLPKLHLEQSVNHATFFLPCEKAVYK